MEIIGNSHEYPRLVNEKAAVLIDNQYLRKVKKDLGLDENGFQIGYLKLSNHMCESVPANRFRTYVYDALRPYEELKTDKEREMRRKTEYFFNSLENQPNFELREGVIKKNEHDVFRKAGRRLDGS